jgi:hypothetical protein
MRRCLELEKRKERNEARTESGEIPPELSAIFC